MEWFLDVKVVPTYPTLPVQLDMFQDELDEAIFLADPRSFGPDFEEEPWER